MNFASGRPLSLQIWIHSLDGELAKVSGEEGGQHLLVQTAELPSLERLGSVEPLEELYSL